MPLYQEIIQWLPGEKTKHRTVLALNSIISGGGRTRAVVNGAKMRLDLNESIQRQMFLGAYEPVQTGWFKECLGTGDVFVDIGASFGHYTTLAAALVGPRGKVFAFEPSPVAGKVLEEAINESELQNVFLTKAAVGKRNGTIELYMPTTTPDLHSPSTIKSDPHFTPIQIPVISLDTFAPFATLESINLMKIDVEGYEPDAFSGMNHLLSEKRIKNIFCEFNSWWLARNLTTPAELLEQILAFGYEIHKKTDKLTGLPAHGGGTFDLQDIWFMLPGDS
jgi:FkbM family methyltransferase